MNRSLRVKNLCRGERVDVARLKRILRALLHDLMDRRDYDLFFRLVDDREMTRVNESVLGHRGSTDVITFNYGDKAWEGLLAGEIYVCIPEARRQAARFRTTWQQELTRYLIHGVLHLEGFDDLTPEQRRVMKLRENRLLSALRKEQDLRQLARAAPRGGP